MKAVVVISLLSLLVIGALSQADSPAPADSAAPEEEVLSCQFDENDERFAGVDPTQQNTIDKLIQKIQGTAMGGFIRRTIARNIKKPDSMFRRMLGRLIQDPADENFDEGDVDITEPVSGPLTSLITKVFGETKTVVGYLRTFGFFAKVLGMSPNKLENYQGGIPPCAITQAVKEFQVFNKLEPSGRLTKETRDLMTKERCGNPDVSCETPDCIADQENEENSEYLARKRRSLSRQKRWEVVSGRTWKSGDFKYFFESYTDDLSVDIQRRDIERGLKEWTEVAQVNFEEVDNADDADVTVGFGAGDHGDKYAFSGPGGVLAHGYYPRKGDMHFDDDEKFTADQYSGTNLYYVATHEFGHVLGIRHTDVKKAVMGPYYPGYQREIDLTADDIAAARELFGEGTGEVRPIGGFSGLEIVEVDEEDAPEEDAPEEDAPEEATEERAGPDNIEIGDSPEFEDGRGCLSEIHAAFNHPTEKYAYVISGGTYVRLEADERNMPVVSEGYPKYVAEQWPGVEGEVDAAFTDYDNGRTFFFVNSYPRRKVYCWNWDESRMEMDGEDEENTVFAPLPQAEIKGIASYRDYVLFLFESEYYLWTPSTGVYAEAQSWPYQSGEKSVHVSGAFDAFLRGYFYTGSEQAPEKYVLFKSRELIEGDGGMVDKYSYRRFDEDMNLDMCY